MVPTLIYVVTNLISVTFRTNFAVATGEGGQAALRYAWQFYQLPYGIFAVALATAIFPELAERANARDMTGFKQMFARGLRSTMVLIVPLAGLLATLATPVITLYQAGRFTADDVPVVAGSSQLVGARLDVLRRLHVRAEVVLFASGHAHTHVHEHRGDHDPSFFTPCWRRGVGGWDGLGIIGIPIADGIFFCGHLLALSVDPAQAHRRARRQGDRLDLRQGRGARWSAQLLHGC